MARAARSESWGRYGLAVMVVAVAAYGCGNASRELTPGSGTNANDVALSFAPPSLAEMKSRLSLTETQTQQIAPGLEAWRQAAAAQNAQSGATGGPPGRPGSGGPGGPGGAPPAPPEFRCPSDPPPHMDYVIASAAALDQNRFVEQGHYLGGRMLAHEQDQRGRGGPLQPVLMRLGHDLRLDRVTMESLMSAAHDAGGALHDLLESYRTGAITAEGLRDQAGNVRETLAGKLDAALSDQAYAKLLELDADLRAKLADCALSGLAEGVDRHVTGLTKMLDLTAEQQQQVRDALAGFQPRIETMLNGIKDGSVKFEMALYEDLSIQLDVDAAIRVLLTADQVAKLEAVADLMHRPVLPLYL